MVVDGAVGEVVGDLGTDVGAGGVVGEAEVGVVRGRG